MLEASGDIWKFHAQGYWIGITTNGFVKNNGQCVMGRGVALQAKERYPDFPYFVGEMLRKHGNVPAFSQGDERLFTFPVKHVWYEKADLKLIESSASRLMSMIEQLNSDGFQLPLYLVRPGCGNGQLSWEEVKPVIESILSDDVCIVDLA